MKITGLELSKKGFRQDIINDAFTRSNIYKVIVHILAFMSLYKGLLWTDCALPEFMFDILTPRTSECAVAWK